MKHVGVLAFSVCFTLAGCVSFSTPMKNARGEIVSCQNSGWGWLGAPVAAINQKRCESNMRERGFVTLGETPSPVTVASTPGFSPTDNAGTPTTQAIARTVKVSIELPAGWNAVTLTEPLVRKGVSVQASNATSEAFMSLSARAKANLTDLRAFALAMQADQAALVSGPELSVLSKIEIAGKPAYAMHVVGKPQGSPQPMRFNMFVVEGANEVALLNVWLPEKLYGSNKQLLDELLTGLKGLDS